MAYPLKLTFKRLALAPQIFVTDAEDKSILYVRQKMLKFKEEVAVYADKTKEVHLFDINADRVIDWSARYHFNHAETGEDLGSIKRHGMRSLFRCHYEIFEDDRVVMNLREENAFTKFFDSMFGEIPVIGLLSGYVFNPKFLISDTDGNPIMRVTKKPSLLESNFQIDLLTETQLDTIEEWRILLSLMMMVLLERARG